MKFNETTLTQEYIYKGKILNLRKDEIACVNGKRSIREVVEHSGGSCVLCEKDGKILFVRQFRYPFKQELLELPAGKLNSGEDPMITAIRELSEEGGIEATKVELLCKIYPSTGYTNEIIYIYRAVEFVEGKAHLDDGEFLDAIWIDKQEVSKMVERGEILDAKTLVALLMVLKQN